MFRSLKAYDCRRTYTRRAGVVVTARILFCLLSAEMFVLGVLSPEPLFSQQTMAVVAAPRRPDWLPDREEEVPVVESEPNCDVGEVLRNSGDRIQEFVSNVERFAARETLLQETINKTGKVSRTEVQIYDYLVSINEIRPGLLSVEEFLTGRVADDSGGITGMITKGLPALVLIFHPKYSMDFAMTCEGLANLHGQPAWQIRFRQKADKPNRIRSYRLGLNGPTYLAPLEGRAWFSSDNYQILKLNADLIGPIPEIELTVDHTAVEYGPVHFSHGDDMWLPKTAELYSDLKHKRIHQLMNFNQYQLFAVDDSQKISVPKLPAE